MRTVGLFRHFSLFSFKLRLSVLIQQGLQGKVENRGQIKFSLFPLNGDYLSVCN